MISQTVVMRSTTLQEVELVDDVNRSKRVMRHTAKQMRKQDILPPQKQVAVSSEGLYLPVFPTEEAKWLIHNIRKTRNVKDAAHIAGVMLGAPLVGLSVFFGGFISNDWVNVGIVSAFGLLFTGPAIVYAQLPISKVSIFHRMRMVDIAYESFAEWAKNRYGITVLKASLEFDAECVIASGYYDGQTAAYVKDEDTGDSYQVISKADNQIYLARWDARKAEAALTSKASIPPLMLEAADVTVVLPDDATVLHSQLMASVALLKTQELSVEVTHQVKRTEEVVASVLAQYQGIAKLAGSDVAHQDLMEFLDGQKQFIDGLCQEQVQELTKKMNVEMTAAAEITRANSLLLAKSTTSA